jgi:protein phosphatase
MKITVPAFCLIVLIGASGSGKSTFARQHFKPTEILSSDFCRALISDQENNQAVTRDAFAVLHFIAAKRLAYRRLTVIDATSVQPLARRPLLQLAQAYGAPPVAIVLDLPEAVCLRRHHHRPDREFSPAVILKQLQELRRSLASGLDQEGFQRVFVLKSEDEVAHVTVWREPRPPRRTPTP